MKIKRVLGREILDSRGNPTIEAELWTEKFSVSAMVPSGASTGIHEALELRDGGERYRGRGVLRAVKNVSVIEQKIKNFDCTKQRKIDGLIIDLDGTANKKRLGANAILSVSMAVCRAGALSKKAELFEHIGHLFNNKKFILPRPFFNVINGGKHAGGGLAVQELMIVPKLKSFKENLRAGSEIYHVLKELIQERYGVGAVNVGDEGGFAPPIGKTEKALELLEEAIKKAGYKGKVDLAMDCAASEFFKNGFYHIDGLKLDKEKLLDYYLNLIKRFKIMSIEDPFEQEDFIGFGRLRVKSGIQVVGDDLTVTNVDRMAKAIKLGSCNCLLLKLNQIGTVTESLAAAHLAMSKGWKVMVSHRSGETTDDFIADLAVGMGCGMIKAGAPCRGERVAKYNRLLKIEEGLKG